MKEICLREVFLSAIQTKVGFKISTCGGARKVNWTPRDKLDYGAVTTKASANLWRALELKWSHRVVPNRGKETRPLSILIYQSLYIN